MNEPRRIFISGTSRGIGRALADHYLALGDEVYGCARNPAPFEHERYHHFEVDLVDEAACATLFQRLRERTTRLDALVNNAGVGRMLPLALTPWDTARRMVELNYLATFRLMHGALRFLRKSTCGRIVNLTTVAVPLRLDGESLYASSKAAVEMLTRTAAKELGPLGITCNAIGPSPIRTDLIANVPEAKLAALVARQAIPLWAEPADVANVIDFFLRPESRLITGQVVYLGGIG